MGKSAKLIMAMSSSPMSSTSSTSAKPIQRIKFEFKNFILPKRYARSHFDFRKATVCAVIPTYKPGEITVRLVENLIRWDTNIVVYVVDDCTPRDYEASIHIFEDIQSISDRVTLIRTPANTLKAGALNYGLKYIFGERGGYVPDVILTLDDDIVITPTTVRNLVTELMEHDDLGAVCSQCHVLNKNRNLLTRLQGLEYLGFNATRLADEGFFMGPLVMHGMLTAFRASALIEVGGFAERHLIEDYEITSRLKESGWSVKSAPNSDAWTIVPENFSTLWRQRTRWSYGGITVVDKVKYLPTVFQDVIGHATFWATLCTIVLLILILLFGSEGGVSPKIPHWIIALSILQVGIWYIFQLWLMGLYREKDAYDWMIRISIIPEFIYANILTLILVGSYFFLFFNTLKGNVTNGSSLIVRQLAGTGKNMFRACGYTESWGTRTQ